VITGCSRESPGCESCYAEGLTATRLKESPKYKGLAIVRDNGEPQFTGEVRSHEDVLNGLLGRRKPGLVFVNSMSDTFHKEVKDEWLLKMMTTFAAVRETEFQLLTKRAVRMKEFFQKLRWKRVGSPAKWVACLDGDVVDPKEVIPNVHMGVSVESQKYASRVTELMQAPVAVRWVSAEPLLSPLDFRGLPGAVAGADFYNALAGCSYTHSAEMIKTDGPRIDWVVAGGESGVSKKLRGDGSPKIRVTDPAWGQALAGDCEHEGVPFLWKQWGEWAPVWALDNEALDRSVKLELPMVKLESGTTMYRCGKKHANRLLSSGDTKVWDQYPKGSLRDRERA
jgi:protein gp37